jgi:myo-inositol-1(or 4)-monophosphatase
MHSQDLDSRFAFARDLVREAGRLALDMRRNPSRLGVEAKGTRDFVTAADRAVEELIVKRLGDTFGDQVLGEEFGGKLSDTLWIVDPIDGTYNYVHDNPRWCVSLGFMCERTLEIGLLYAPARDEMYVARRGHGATLNGKRMSVSGDRYLGQPLVEVGSSSRRPLQDYLGLVERLMTAGYETRRCGSGALGLAQVATGTIDAYVESHINSWDVAAGILLVTEAGGWTNDFFAGDGLSAGNPILACTPAMRDALSEMTGIA